MSDKEASKEKIEYLDKESPNIRSKEKDIKKAKGKEMARREANSGSLFASFSDLLIIK